MPSYAAETERMLRETERGLAPSQRGGIAIGGHLSFSSGPKFIGSFACLLGLLWDRPRPWSG